MELGFSGRLRRCLPLYVLRWSLILMNEFLPERWHERHQAGVASDHEAAKAVQIEKLGRLLAPTLVGHAVRPWRPGRSGSSARISARVSPGSAQPSATSGPRTMRS